RAAPGFRTAVNLRGLEKSAISRGDVLATPGSLRTTNILDIELRLLPRATAPLKHRQYVRVLFGTRETYAHVHLLDRDVLDPGEVSCLQLRLDEETAVLAREPLIIRSYSPMQTIGGGVVLDAADHGYRRRQGPDMERLRALADGKPSRMVRHKLAQARLQTTPVRDLARDLRLGVDVVRASIREIGAVTIAKEFAIAAESVEAVCNELIVALQRYHEEKPTSPGVPREEIPALLATKVEDRLLNYAIDSAHKDLSIEAEAGVLRVAGFDPVGVMSAADREAVEQLEAAFRDAKFEPPDLDEAVGEDVRRQKLYKYLLDSKRLIAARITTRNQNQNKYIAFHANSIAEARAQLERAFTDPGKFTTLEAKDVLGVTRKYLIPLLEIVDSQGFTRRQDDTRYIRRS
ncbi:MAG: SelB C-terminal domain-containing protein, partial [Candidatus Hydrogenedentota bacterium]